MGNNNSAGGSVQLLVNRGDGTFVYETPARLGPRAKVLTGYGWSRVVVVDINYDGKLDILALVASGAGAPPDFAWTNNGDGTFTPHSKSEMLRLMNGDMLPIDANGDGNYDIVVMEYEFNTGNLKYQTYLNTSTRAVPSEPLIVIAVAGDAQARHGVLVSRQLYRVTGRMARGAR